MSRIMHKLMTRLITTLVSVLFAGCVTSVDQSLPYDRLPEITVATQFNLVASPSHPTAYLSSDPIPAGEKVQVIGADQDAAWLLVLQDNILGWMPTFYSRTNVATLQTAVVIEPLSDKCTKYLNTMFAPDEAWVNSTSSAVFVVGSIYRPQTATPFEAATLDIEIDGGGVAVKSDYVHTSLTPSSALILFGFSVAGLQEDSRLHFSLTNPSNEPLSFQAAFFSNECPETLGQLPVGKPKVVEDGGVAPPKADKPTPTQLPATPTPTAILIEGGLRQIFTLDLSNYEIGDLANDFGMDLLVNEEDGERFLSGLDNHGRVELRNLELQDNFEVTFIVDFNNSDSVVALQSGSGEEIGIVFGDEIIFGNTSNNYNKPWKSGSSLNRCRLLVNGDTAKLYINDIFFGTALVDPGVNYNRFIISNIGQDEKVQHVAATELSGEDAVQANEKALTSDQTGFAVNLNMYEIGDVPEELGTDLLIQSTDNKNYVTGLSDEGRVELQDLELQDNFEITFIVDFSVHPEIRSVTKQSDASRGKWFASTNP